MNGSSLPRCLGSQPRRFAGPPLRRRERTACGAGLLALLAAGGANDALGQEPLPGEPSSSPYALTSLATLALVAIIGIGAFYAAIRYAGRKARARREDEERAAERFEQAIMRSLQTGGETSTTPVAGRSEVAESPAAVPARSQMGEESPNGGMAAAPTSAGSAPRSPASAGDAAMAEVIARLRTAGLLDTIGESETLDPALPPIQQMALRGNKRGILFPARTPMALALRYEKSADYLFLVQDDGTTLVCRSLGDFIADTLFEG